MDSNKKSCILIVDMINDFVTGKFGNSKAVAAVKNARSLLMDLKGMIPIIFAKDDHIKNDPEFMVWGEHALHGTWNHLCMRTGLKQLLYRNTCKTHLHMYARRICPLKCRICIFY